MNEIEQKLWADVYAAEYARLTHRISTYEKKEESSRGEHRWQYGSACDGDEASTIAKRRADQAVAQLRAVK